MTASEKIRTAGVLATGALLHVALLVVPPMCVAASTEGLATAAVACFVLLAVAWQCIEGAIAPCGPASSLRSTAPRWLPAVSSLVLLGVFWVSLSEHLAAPRSTAGWLVPLGVATMALGGGLRCGALHSLGPRFVSEVALAACGRLHTRGIYQVLRHPSEAGNLCLAVGAAATLGSGLGLMLALLVQVPLVVWRCGLEDRMLAAEFGEAFTTYRRRVPGLIPALPGMPCRRIPLGG